MTLIYSSTKNAKDPRLKDPISVTYDCKTDRVGWVAEPWREAVVDCDYLYGDCYGDEWLNSMGAYYSGEAFPDVAFANNVLPPKYTYGSVEPISPAEIINSICDRCDQSEFPLVFLDSFSVIENGEQARRVDRLIETSPGERALMSLFKDSPEAVFGIGPREFETLVAYTLKELGFSRVELRRYVKDNGVDIMAVLATANAQEETVVIEVKHGRKGITYSTIDRLNGVRARLGAQRALAIASYRVTRSAKVAYEGHETYIQSYTFRELIAILADSNDWFQSPHGLWTKKISSSNPDSV